MAVLANQREYVRRPGSLTPSYGLFTVTRAMGTLIDTMPGHAGQGGLEYETFVCGLPACYASNCITDLGTKPAGTTTTTVLGNPFNIVTPLSCGSVGMTEQRLRDFLYEKAAAGEQARVEQVFSVGACGQAPSLSNNTPPATDLGASANPVLAFGKLEEALYSVYGLTGVIHVPYSAGPWLTANHLIEKDVAGVWRTAAGTAVSIGNYDGLGPAGGAPGAGATFFYITGQVSIWRTPESQVFYTPLDAALDRSTNQVNGYREREYIVTFECSAFTTETTLVVA